MKRVIIVVILLSALAACGGSDAPPDDGTWTRTEASPSSTAPDAPSTPTESPTPTAVPGTATATSPAASPAPSSDPRNRFYTDDRTRYASPWYQGRYRIMIDYGCTRAPYYEPDPRCSGGRGFHHGIDIAVPCGAEIRAGTSGRVVDPSRPGAPGPAYGSTAFRIRTAGGSDILIGHARRTLVDPGDRVRRGQPIALSGARGAPDGCHLHLEVRTADGGLDSATDPSKVIALRP